MRKEIPQLKKKIPWNFLIFLNFILIHMRDLIISNSFDYTVYTDGACLGNPGKGGWAAIIFDFKNQKTVLCGFDNSTTNNRMEIIAIIEALKNINKKSNINLITDSKYVIDGINDWIKKWVNNNWKTSNNKDVKNKDLWIELNTLNQFHNINWEWVKGHSGDIYNEEVDKIAREQAKNL